MPVERIRQSAPGPTVLGVQYAAPLPLPGGQLPLSPVPQSQLLLYRLLFYRLDHRIPNKRNLNLKTQLQQGVVRSVIAGWSMIAILGSVAGTARQHSSMYSRRSGLLEEVPASGSRPNRCRENGQEGGEADESTGND